MMKWEKANVAVAKLGEAWVSILKGPTKYPAQWMEKKTHTRQNTYHKILELRINQTALKVVRGLSQSGDLHGGLN